MLNQSVTCDKCGKGVQTKPVSLMAKGSCYTRADWLRYFRGKGWSFGKKDLCPNCKIMKRSNQNVK